MIDKAKLKLFEELFNDSQSILIMCADTSARDELFASVSLFSAIREKSEKNIKLLCPINLSTQEKDIIGLDNLQTEIGHENLCISVLISELSAKKLTAFPSIK